MTDEISGARHLQERRGGREGTGLAAILEGTIRELVRQEVTAALSTMEPRNEAPGAVGRWRSPPDAAREVGISVKAVRNMIKDGVVGSRLRNVSQNPTQRKYLVNADDVAAVAGRVGSAVSGRSSVEEEARQILARRDSRR
jgi:hypothetical protein